MRLLLIALLLGFVASCGGPPVGDSDVLALIGATVIDGTGSQPVADATLLIREGRILAVGPNGAIDIPAAAETIDADGKTIIPGLADLHSHYAIYEPNTDVARSQLGFQLAYGVTTVRSVGLDAAETMVAIEEVKAGNAPGPRVFTAGLGFGQPGGAPAQFGLDYVHQPETAEQAREGVRLLASQKVDLIKIWAGTRNADVPTIRPEIAGAIVDEAGKHDIPIVAHVAGRAQFDLLYGLGVRDFLHALDPEDADDPGFLESLQADGVRFTPTLSGTESNTILAQRASLLESDPGLRVVLSVELRQRMANPDWREQRTAGEAFARRQADLESALRFTGKLHQAGVTVLPGSDCPVTPHGWATHNELRLLVEAGMQPLEAIRAATGAAAQALGSDEFGTLVSGAAADLIVLDADPLQAITNTLKIQRVMQGGKWVDRDALLGL